MSDANANEEQVEDSGANGQQEPDPSPTETDEGADGREGQEGQAASEEPPAPSEPSLEEQLDKAKQDIKTVKEKMLRVAADFDNFRKRSSREVEDARRRGFQAAVRDLLPVFDNLERATAHVTEQSDPKSIADGVKMVLKLFLDTIGKQGIERVEALGKPFDPNVHDGMQHLHSDEHDAGVVMQELQPGYRMGTELLRPALVIVSKGPEPQQATEQADDGAEEADESQEKEAAGDEQRDASQPEGDQPEGDDADGD